MEFYWGDTIVCVSNVINKKWDYRILDKLTIGKSYVVISRSTTALGVYYQVIDDSGNDCFYNEFLFEGLKEYRSVRIDEILS